jgi:hypothetical protein
MASCPPNKGVFWLKLRSGADKFWPCPICSWYRPGRFPLGSAQARGGQVIQIVEVANDYDAAYLGIEFSTQGFHLN